MVAISRRLCALPPHDSLHVFVDLPIFLAHPAPVFAPVLLPSQYCYPQGIFSDLVRSPPDMSPYHSHSLLSLLAIFPLAALAFPSTLHTELSPRDNKYGLKCGNAPNVTAGKYVVSLLFPVLPQFLPSRIILTHFLLSLCSQADVYTSMPDPFLPSGSDEEWYSYLWCTPGTNTYTFFNVGEIWPPPIKWFGNLSHALDIAIHDITTWLASNPDGPVWQPGQEQVHYWNTWDKSSDFVVFAEGYKSGTLTFGILHSALTGLLQFMQAGQIASSGYNKGNDPLVFQINDGQWGEVGIGYVGFTGWPGMGCVYQVIDDKPSDCVEILKDKVIH